MKKVDRLLSNASSLRIKDLYELYRGVNNLIHSHYRGYRRPALQHYASASGFGRHMKSNNNRTKAPKVTIRIGPGQFAILFILNRNQLDFNQLRHYLIVDFFSTNQQVERAITQFVKYGIIQFEDDKTITLTKDGLVLYDALSKIAMIDQPKRRNRQNKLEAMLARL